MGTFGPVRTRLFRLGHLHPALGEGIFVFWAKVADYAVLKSRPQAIGHFAVANNARGDQDGRFRIAGGGALQLLTEQRTHLAVCDFIQSINQQQNLTFGDAIEDDGVHDLGLFRLEFRLGKMHPQHVGEGAAEIGWA